MSLPGARRLPDSLLARSFLLIALLIVLSVLATFQLYLVYEREPRARELAQQTISIVNLTRAALVNADPFLRRELLIELNESEGIRIFPVTADDKLQPLPKQPLFDLVAERVRAALGKKTRFAFARDALEGFWVSFYIDDDEYWAMLPRERFEPVFAWQWLGWGLALLALALLGAWLIASRITRSLAALAGAARRVGRGEVPEPVPEVGPPELRTLAGAFNRMASDLDRMERERATVLAGISHDLRTPLARLRLGVEMSGGDVPAMAADIDEMNAVIEQFLDYARGEPEAKVETNIESVVDEVVAHYARLGKRVTRQRGETQRLALAPAALRRAISNLVNNALDYAGEPVEIGSGRSDGFAFVEVRDRGPGIPPGEAERLKRPFTRLDEARSGRGGAGLGLAIVERIARAHGGGLDLLPREGGGLVARLKLAV